jgi:hypothetical protein
MAASVHHFCGRTASAPYAFVVLLEELLEFLVILVGVILGIAGRMLPVETGRATFVDPISSAMQEPPKRAEVLGVVRLWMQASAELTTALRPIVRYVAEPSTVMGIALEELPDLAEHRPHEQARFH